MGSSEFEQAKAHLHVDCAQPPAITWQRKFDDEGKKVAMLSMTTDILTVIPLIFKMLRLHVEGIAKNQVAVYDPLRKWMDNCYRGVPLGGLGSGSIGRSYRGYFQQFQLFPRIYEEKPILANQFSAFVSRSGRKSYSTVLSAPNAHLLKGIDNKAGIRSWDWKLKEKNCNYHGLFPRSWTVYDGEPDPEIKITCRQISPFIPHNYKESSFPVAVFTFTVQNSGSTPADVTLLFTWANSVGGKSELTGNHNNSRIKARDGVHGVLLRHRTAEGNPPVTFAIASQETGDVRVTCCPSFAMGPYSPGGREQFTAKDMWDEVKKHGSFGEAAGGAPTASSRLGSSIGAAVAATTKVPAGGTRVVSFALSWSCPEVKFPSGRTYHRRYTKFLGLDRDAAAEQLAHDALLGEISKGSWSMKISESL
uniref:Glycosyl-hydrolase family 116 N-terminal domain-containing protein n=1 Tax=Aegilops tauschii subsp. strangulata TaxID=200361 RepID=A0A453S2R8_AEGTS